MNTSPQTVVLADLPSVVLSSAVTYLADVLRECQLVLVGRDQGSEVDPTLATLAEGLVPDLEELSDLFRGARVTEDGETSTVEIELAPADAALLAHLQMQLVQLRFVGRRGGLLVSSDPAVTGFLAWVWDEAADQLYGRTARPFPGL